MQSILSSYWNLLVWTVFLITEAGFIGFEHWNLLSNAWEFIRGVLDLNRKFNLLKSIIFIRYYLRTSTILWESFGNIYTFTFLYLLRKSSEARQVKAGQRNIRILHTPSFIGEIHICKWPSILEISPRKFYEFLWHQIVSALKVE